MKLERALRGAARREQGHGNQTEAQLPAVAEYGVSQGSRWVSS
jgi:hypothetical protein